MPIMFPFRMPITNRPVEFWIAHWVGWKWALVLVLVIEVVLLFWIRDNLLLTIVMPICPIESIKHWQLGG